MVGREARADQRDLAGPGVVHREMPVGLLEREELRRGMGRPLPAEIRIGRRADARGEPHAAFLVEHRVVHAGLAVPDRLRPPVRRRQHGVLLRRGRGGIAHQHLHLRRLVVHRIEDREQIGALLRRPEDQAVGVDARIALVGRDLVVQVVLGPGPVPQRQDDVALDAVRTGRPGGRQLAGGDAIGPVGEQLQRARRAEPAEIRRHLQHRLAGLDAPLPGVGRRRELAERLRDRARRLVAELMTRVAAVGLDHVEPLGLALEGGRDAVAVGSGAGEVALVRHLEHRVPVDRRIVFGGGGRARRHHRVQIEKAAGRGANLRRVDQAVATHPHAVLGPRQIRQHVAPLVVGDDDPRELRRQLVRLRDHPDSGFRPVGAPHDAAEVGVADTDRGVPARLGAGPALAGGERQRDHDRHRRCRVPCSGRRHRRSPGAARAGAGRQYPSTAARPRPRV